VESARGLLRRVAETLATPPIVILSGGWASLLQTHLGQQIDVHDPHLVLRGVYLLLECNPDRGLP
jgi:type III pantothenate kinase